MHFPLPMPAFDLVSIDGPYYAVGNWQNRVFAVPPAMGVDYRIVNGYVYISANPADPAKMAERAEYFEKRAGYYFANWDELYGKWKDKMQDLIAQLAALEVPDLPEYESDEVAFGDRSDELGRAARRLPADAAHGRGDVAAPFRVPAARLRRLPDVLGPVQGEHARHPRPAHRADDRRHRRPAVPPRRRAAPPGAPRRRHGRRRRVRQTAARPRQVDAELAHDRRRARVARRAREGQGPVVQHGHRRRALPLLPQLERRSEHPVRLDQRPHHGDRRRPGRRAPDGKRLEEQRDRLAARVRGAARRRRTRAVRGAAGACRGRCSPTSRSTSSTATTGS